MPRLHGRTKYDYSFDDLINNATSKKATPGELRFAAGYKLLNSHPLFSRMDGDIYPKYREVLAGGGFCAVDFKGDIYCDANAGLSSEEWAYVMAHALLHLAFGHFDKANMPNENMTPQDIRVWNKACDLFIARFLADVKFGSPICPDPGAEFSIKLDDESKIFSHLKHIGDDGTANPYGTNKPGAPDMIGIDKPVEYKTGEENEFAAAFLDGMKSSVNQAVSIAAGRSKYNKKSTVITKAADWFLSRCPLLGGIGASFKIIEDADMSFKNEISVAAVDPVEGVIYCNPSAGLTREEWKFVLAHEYLHAGLMHHKRTEGRDAYLWNIACDFCVNGWLHDMEIGQMPDGALFDKSLKDMSAEAIYDIIVKDMRKYRKLMTLRGYEKADILWDALPTFGGLKTNGDGVSLDEFYKNALREGLDFHSSNKRGYLPAGLVQEIHALTSPPIPWDVELGKWFDAYFPPLEKHRSYARASRRQSSTPDIPRPNYILTETDVERTFGVVLDTSGSMSLTQLKLSLGAIASYAASKDVLHIRVVFCDAGAYDAGYMSTDELAGRVRIVGRGGTELQPGVNLLINSRDFPKDAPILLITDGEIEDRVTIPREHAFLMPKGAKLPFKPKGQVFHFK